MDNPTMAAVSARRLRGPRPALAGTAASSRADQPPSGPTSSVRSRGVGGNGIEPDAEHVARRIDDLDLVADARPQRAGQVAGIGTCDGDAPAGPLGKK